MNRNDQSAISTPVKKINDTSSKLRVDAEVFTPKFGVTADPACKGENFEQKVPVSNSAHQALVSSATNTQVLELEQRVSKIEKIIIQAAIQENLKNFEKDSRNQDLMEWDNLKN